MDITVSVHHQLFQALFANAWRESFDSLRAMHDTYVREPVLKYNYVEQLRSTK